MNTPIVQRLIFRVSVSLTSLKSQTRDPRLMSLPEDLLSGLLSPGKIQISAGFEPPNLGYRASMLPRDHQDRHRVIYLISAMVVLIRVSSDACLYPPCCIEEMNLVSDHCSVRTIALNKNSHVRGIHIFILAVTLQFIFVWYSTVTPTFKYREYDL